MTKVRRFLGWVHNSNANGGTVRLPVVRHLSAVAERGAPSISPLSYVLPQKASWSLPERDWVTYPVW